MVIVINTHHHHHRVWHEPVGCLSVNAVFMIYKTFIRLITSILEVVDDNMDSSYYKIFLVTV